MEYTSVSIPKPIVTKLKKIVGRGGYKSVADIVLWCIRMNMFRIDQVLTEIEEADKDVEKL